MINALAMLIMDLINSGSKVMRSLFTRSLMVKAFIFRCLSLLGDVSVYSRMKYQMRNYFYLVYPSEML